MVEQFQSYLVGIGFQWFVLIWSKKSFLSFNLFTIDPQPQEKSSLPIWFTIIHMIIEEILSPATFVTDWTPVSHCKTSDFFFFWLKFLVSSSPSLLIWGSHIPHRQTQGQLNLLSFQGHRYQYHLVFPQLLQIFLKGSLFNETVIFFKSNKSISAKVVSSILSHIAIFVSLARKEISESKSNKIIG